MNSSPAPAQADADISVPIVFVHGGNAPHLSRAMAMARTSDPGRKIVLLGDTSNRAMARSLGVEHVSQDDFSAGARRLDAIYVHRSTNGRDFELACLQRWFTILEWMEATGQPRAICLDSDVLLFAPFASVLASLAHFPMTMVIDAAHTSVVNERSTLAAYCALVEDHYSSAEGRQRLETLYQAHLANSDRGGISDMTFLHLLRRDRPDLLASVPGPLGEAGWMLDLTLNDGVGGFEMAGAHKRIVWRGGVPHAHRVADDTWVPFLTLHFQGVAKHLLPHYVRGVPWAYRVAVWLNDLRQFLARLGRQWQRLRNTF